LLLSADQIAENVAGVSRQLSSFLDVGPGGARLVDNASWLARLDLLGFLRDTGKHFTVNYLLQKESVSRRLESEEGISFTEFSYSLLQARDYLELFERYGCRLQIGGSDQWGNITAGIELIRKLRGERVHGLVIPLLTTASGQKFGKTEAGAVWLDPARTSPYRFYQFWMNTDDADVVRYLRYFTFLTREEIEDLERASRGEPEKRAGQRVLAAELTRLVHGADQLARAERASALLFGEPIEGLSASEVLAVFYDVPSTEISESDVRAGLTVVDLVVRAALAPSKSEARRLVQAGGIYVNNSRTTEPAARFGRANAIDGRVLVVRKGARQNHVFVLT
jgi:tyrosyl-tRNA synthetase